MLKFSLGSTADMSTSNPTQHHNSWASHAIPDDANPNEHLIVKESKIAVRADISPAPNLSLASLPLLSIRSNMSSVDT